MVSFDTSLDDVPLTTVFEYWCRGVYAVYAELRARRSWRKVNARVVGCVWRQPSRRPNVDLRFARAFVADCESGCWGRRSRDSSTMLQSPSMMSIVGRLSSSHFVWRSAQKEAFSEGVLGAYIARMLRVGVRCHGMDMRRARPGMISWWTVSVQAILRLLRMIATPLAFG
jgi:hypothetical protein